VDWLTFASASGSSGGSVLTYNVAAYTGTASRTGTITLQAGRLLMDITVTQLHTAAIESLNTFATYPMDGRNNTFTVKSSFDWKVRVEVEENVPNIVTAFDHSGAKNTSATNNFNFTLIDDTALGFLFENVPFKFIFYSATDEFVPQIVETRGLSYFEFPDIADLSHLQVYLIDQPTGKTWHVYANVVGTTVSFDIPPVGSQENPPREFSCADLPRSDGNQWRLPVLDELKKLSDAVKSNYTYYGFADATAYATAYWSATSADISSYYANYVNVSTGSQSYNGKEATTNRARCVRDK
jgi:hypothetical protein